MRTTSLSHTVLGTTVPARLGLSRAALSVLVLALMLGCAAQPASIDAERTDGGAPLDAALAPDAGSDAGPPAPGLAPAGTVPGATTALDGAQPIAIAPGIAIVLELVVYPDEHVGFFLRFEPTAARVVMHVDRWDGEDVTELGLTDAGPGLRTLAVLEPSARNGGARTHWVRIEAGVPLDATLEVVRTPFQDAPRCTQDCELLLQLPLPIDLAIDGYAWTPSTIMRYWFGRRDLVMLIRHATRAMADRGHAPVLIGDLSQWDGLTPGSDTGSLRHASHQRGKDVDITLYGTDGEAPWRSYCTTTDGGSGRECVAGTIRNYDGARNAALYAGFLQSGRVTMSFLDQELIGPTALGAEQAAGEGAVDPALVPLYADGQHLQHWPNHDNHIHVRVSEEPYAGGGAALAPPAFEPP
ncbi:MAG: penicillin-insensitive murein endopeptidase [Sandaracinaceae bacterium]|nr:penicillin-insensitive murein endopeptidase [Sandaracinaceae bacterium]